MENNQPNTEFFTNSQNMTFRCIRFKSLPPQIPNSQPRLRNIGVVHADFAIGIHLVTQQDYYSLMKESPSYFQGDNVANEDSGQFPVEYVSCVEAVKFCQKLSSLPSESKLHRQYRLPTEAEWEFACLAGKNATSDGTDLSSDIQDYAWIEQNSGNRPHPVGQKRPNPWGIFDMSGNVWEWCLDLPEVYDQEMTDERIKTLPEFSCSFRGGDYGCSPDLCGTAKVHRVSSSYCGNFVGFRLALDL